MATKTKYVTIGFIILAILAASILVTLGDDVRIKITKTSSTFYINESGNWIISGVEYNKIWQSNYKSILSANSSINSEINGNNSKIIRNALYSDGTKIIDTYEFNGDNKNKEDFPVSHTIEIYGAKGKEYHYLVNKIAYSGPTIKALSGIDLGRKMKVTFDDGYYSAVLKTGSLLVKYKIDSDYKKINIRLFDPEPAIRYCYQESANTTNQSGLDGNCGLYYSGSYSTTTNYFYINYTKPSGSNNQSLWQVKHSNFSIYNISILDQCWTYDSNILPLRFYSSVSGNNETSNGQCYNGTNWVLISNQNSAYSAGYSVSSGGESRLYDGNWSTASFQRLEEPWSNCGGNGCRLSEIYEEAMIWAIEENTDIVGCQLLSHENTYYELKNNITTTGTCLNITANNITLNLNGYNITGDNSGADYGIYIIGANNTQIYNGLVNQFGKSTSGVGIYLLNSWNNQIYNISSLNSNSGIKISGGGNNTISNSTLSSNGAYGIDMTSSSVNNTINNLIASSNTNTGVYMSSTSNGNIVSNVNGTGNQYILAVSSNNVVDNINATNPTTGGIVVSGSSNSISNIIIKGLGSYILTIQNGANYNNITNATLYGASTSGIYIASAFNNTLSNINSYSNGVYSIFSFALGNNILKYENEYGSILFTNSSLSENLTIRGSLSYPGNIRISNNSAYVNASAFTSRGINSTANVTIYYPNSLLYPRIYNDGSLCSSCYNFTSLNGPTILFNVSSWSTYSINESASFRTNFSQGIYGLIFKPSSRFDQRLWATNQTYSKGVFNLTNTGLGNYNSIWMYVNSTTPTWELQCNNGTSGTWKKINTTAVQVHSNLNVNRSQMIWCRVNLNNATSAWNFQTTFEGRI